jgi:hypothetical protein
MAGRAATEGLTVGPGTVSGPGGLLIELSPSGHRFAETYVRRYAPAVSALRNPRTAQTMNTATSPSPTP